MAYAFPKTQSSKPARHDQSPRLDSRLIRHRSNTLWPVAFQRNSPGFPRHRWLSLQVHLLAFLLRLPPLLCIFLHATEEFVSAARVLDVLDPNIDTLLDVAIADLLVAYYTDC